MPTQSNFAETAGERGPYFYEGSAGAHALKISV